MSCFHTISPPSHTFSLEVLGGKDSWSASLLKEAIPFVTVFQKGPMRCLRHWWCLPHNGNGALGVCMEARSCDPASWRSLICRSAKKKVSRKTHISDWIAESHPWVSWPIFSPKIIPTSLTASCVFLTWRISGVSGVVWILSLSLWYSCRYSLYIGGNIISGGQCGILTDQ